MSEVTRILSAIEQGDPCAAGQLLPHWRDRSRIDGVNKTAKRRTAFSL
jgi:hypothetical protein